MGTLVVVVVVVIVVAAVVVMGVGAIGEYVNVCSM